MRYKKSLSLALLVSVVFNLLAPFTSLTLPKIALADQTIVSANSAPCVPPATGDWNITTDCIFSGNSILQGSLTVDSGKRLTLAPDSKLLLDFKNYKLVVKKDAGIQIKKGAVLRQVKSSDTQTETLPQLSFSTSSPINISIATLTDFINPDDSATFTQPYQNLSYPIPIDGQIFYGQSSGNGTSIYYRKGYEIINFDFQNIGNSVYKQKLSELGLTSGTYYPIRIPNETGTEYIYSPQWLAVTNLGFTPTNINNSNQTFTADISGADLQKLGREYFKQKTNIDATKITKTFNLADVLNCPVFKVISFDENFDNLVIAPVLPYAKTEVITRTISPVNPQGADITSSINGVLFRSPSLAENLARAGATPEQISALILKPSTEMTAEELSKVLGTYIETQVTEQALPANINPIINEFTSNKTTVNPGEPVTLNWDVSGTPFVAITSLVGPFSAKSSITIFPTKTSTYTLVADELGKISRSLTINVSNLPITNFKDFSFKTYVFAIGGESTSKIVIPKNIYVNQVGNSIIEYFTVKSTDNSKTCLENGGVTKCLSVCNFSIDAKSFSYPETVTKNSKGITPLGISATDILCDLENKTVYIGQSKFIAGNLALVSVIPMNNLVYTMKQIGKNLQSDLEQSTQYLYDNSDFWRFAMDHPYSTGSLVGVGSGIVLVGASTGIAYVSVEYFGGIGTACIEFCNQAGQLGSQEYNTAINWVSTKFGSNPDSLPSRAEVQSVMDKWAGTNMSTVESILYHFSKHAYGSTLSSLTQNGLNVWNNFASNSSLVRSVSNLELMNGEIGTKIELSSGAGGIFTQGGNIVTTWFK